MKRIAFIIIIFNIALSYEFTTFSEMTFPLGMTSDGSTVVGSNMYNQAVIWNADSYSSGVYFVKMVAGEYIHTQKLMLIK